MPPTYYEISNRQSLAIAIIIILIVGMAVWSTSNSIIIKQLVSDFDELEAEAVTNHQLLMKLRQEAKQWDQRNPTLDGDSGSSATPRSSATSSI